MAEAGGVLLGWHGLAALLAVTQGTLSWLGSLLGEASLNAAFSDHYLANGERWELKSKASWAQCLWTREEKMLLIEQD